MRNMTKMVQNSSSFYMFSQIFEYFTTISGFFLACIQNVFYMLYDSGSISSFDHELIILFYAGGSLSLM